MTYLELPRADERQVYKNFSIFPKTIPRLPLGLFANGGNQRAGFRGTFNEQDGTRQTEEDTVGCLAGDLTRQSLALVIADDHQIGAHDLVQKKWTQS